MQFPTSCYKLPTSYQGETNSAWGGDSSRFGQQTCASTGFETCHHNFIYISCPNYPLFHRTPSLKKVRLLVGCWNCYLFSNIIYLIYCLNSGIRSFVPLGSWGESLMKQVITELIKKQNRIGIQIVPQGKKIVIKKKKLLSTFKLRI